MPQILTSRFLLLDIGFCIDGLLPTCLAVVVEMYGQYLRLSLSAHTLKLDVRVLRYGGGVEPEHYTVFVAQTTLTVTRVVTAYTFIQR